MAKAKSEVKKVDQRAKASKAVKDAQLGKAVEAPVVVAPVVVVVAPEVKLAAAQERFVSAKESGNVDAILAAMDEVVAAGGKFVPEAEKEVSDVS
jgi:hypothetical protein